MGAGGPGAWMADFGAARAGLEQATASSVPGTWLEVALTVVSLLVCSAYKRWDNYTFVVLTQTAVHPPTKFLTLSRYKPRTTSDIRFSSTGSPCVLTTQPGRGGKLVAAKSNLGGDTFTSAKGAGFWEKKKAKFED